MVVEMLPARHGIACGSSTGRLQVQPVLIDGGPVDTFRGSSDASSSAAGPTRLRAARADPRRCGSRRGLVRFFADKPPQMTVRQVWFNGWRQMRRPTSARSGAGRVPECTARETRHARWSPDAPPWVVPGAGALPIFPLDGGLTLTLLSPDARKLDSMATAWEKRW